MEKVKQLREKTGAGMVDCKKALDETGGDVEKAIELLRKKGIAKAAKRGDRDADEGIIKLGLSDDGAIGYMVELNSETDFVSRNEKFQNLASDILEKIKENNPENLDELNALSMKNGTIKETVDNLSGTIGEKMDVKDFAILKTKGTISAYSHMNGRIGVLVALNKSSEEELAKNIAMHVAAANPSFLFPDEVPQKDIDKEKEIYKEQLLKEGKPENIIDKIMEGKIAKYKSEICLLEQEYVMEDKKKVKDILGDVKIEKFVRYSL